MQITIVGKPSHATNRVEITLIRCYFRDTYRASTGNQ